MGEEVRETEVFIRNEIRPEGVLLSVNGTPLRDEAGQIQGLAHPRGAEGARALPPHAAVPGLEVSLRDFLQDRKIQLLLRHNLLEPGVLLLELLESLGLVEP